MPEQYLNPNPDRIFLSILMLPTSIAAGNVGRVHVGQDATPTATVGDPTQGDILVGGTELVEEENFPNDPSVFTGAVIMVASAAAQYVLIDERLRRK